MLQLSPEQQREVQMLLSGHGSAVHIQRAFSPELASALGKWAREHPRRSNAPLFASGSAFLSSMDQVGVPWTTFYHALEHEGSLEKVYALQSEARQFTNELRAFCSPELPPVWQLLDHLKESWPHGAELAQFQGWAMSLGYIRILESSRNSKPENDPHVDRLPLYLLPIKRQFSAIMYLTLPPDGGELEVWNLPPEEVSDKLQRFAIMQRADLPSPTLISPKPGDIVFLNSGRPHAVRGFKEGVRIVQTCFIGSLTTGNTLVLWN